MSENIKQVIFDFGAVLVDWNPSAIAAAVSPDKQQQFLILEQVLQHSDWLDLDRGLLNEATACEQAVQRGKIERETVLATYQTVRQRLQPITQNVEVLRRLVANTIPCYGLTNMSNENMAFLRKKYDFFALFRDIVVSAEENIIKPSPVIFECLLQGNKLNAETTLFIDDTEANCRAAEKLGIKSIHLPPGRNLSEALKRFNFI